MGRYTNPEDQQKVSAYQFARGMPLLMGRQVLDSMLADLPPGTPVEVTEMSEGWVEAQVTEPVDVPEPELSGPLTVDHGRYVLRHPWPIEAVVNGGRSGLVLSRTSDSYTTAFVEASLTEPATFLRGEGATIEEAEDTAWAKYQRVTANDHDHEFETRGYSNGAGFCKHCNLFQSGIFSLQEIGSVCHLCGDDMYDTVAGQMYCKAHAPSAEEARRMRQEYREKGNPTNPIEDLLDALAEPDAV